MVIISFVRSAKRQNKINLLYINWIICPIHHRLCNVLFYEPRCTKQLPDCRRDKSKHSKSPAVGRGSLPYIGLQVVHSKRPLVLYLSPACSGGFKPGPRRHRPPVLLQAPPVSWPPMIFFANITQICDFFAFPNFRKLSKFVASNKRPKTKSA